MQLEFRRSALKEHKFQIGETVYFTSRPIGHMAANSTYQVVRLLPSDGADYQYRIKNANEAFERVDVVAMPTSPTPPFKLGERTSDPLQMYLADIFTVSANLAGLPAVSMPCGFTPSASGTPSVR